MCIPTKNAETIVEAGACGPAKNDDEVKDMSPKELLYIEDALGHTQFLVKQCRETAAQLTDPVLREQALQLANSNQQLFDRFFSLV